MQDHNCITVSFSHDGSKEKTRIREKTHSHFAVGKNSYTRAVDLYTKNWNFLRNKQDL